LSKRYHRFGSIRILALAALLLSVILSAPTAVGTHGGEFSINSRAANPTTFGTVFPITQSCPSGGQASEPIPGAQHATGVNSLTPSTMVLGEIVPFEFRVTVGAGAPADSSIELVATWDTVTTPSGDFGYDETYLVYCAFVDTGDPSTSDPEADASVSVTSALVGTNIEGTFEVVGLDPGDVVVVEAWVVLNRSVPSGISGNVQARMASARTLTPDEDTINLGAETVNLQPNENFLRAIMVQKLIDSGSDQTQIFDFSGEITATLGHGEVSTPVIVTDGSYQVTEALPAGWGDPSIACDDDDSSGSGSTASFEVSLETILCTFTNAQVAATTTTTTTSTTTSSTTTTTQPTLPFTGGKMSNWTTLALVLVALGGLVLAAVRRQEAD
jgi:hypothetical protein